MAITLKWHDILEKYEGVKRYWEDIDEFERFYLKYLQETIPDWIYYTNSLEEAVVHKPIDHFPQLKKYQVWREGYMATGESGRADLMGEVEARNFRQACNMVACAAYLNAQEEVLDVNSSVSGFQGRWDYDPHALTYWGCSMSWNEQIARKVYG